MPHTAIGDGASLVAPAGASLGDRESSCGPGLLLRPVIVAGALALAIALLYGWRVRDYFIDDALFVISENRAPFTWETLGSYAAKTHMWGTRYRPLYELTVWLNWHMVGLNPVAYHVTNLVIYWAGASLTFLCLAGLVRSRAAALVGALLFVVQGYHPEPVLSMGGRNDLFFGLFTFATLWAYMRASAGGKQSRLWYLVSLAFFGGALLAKETSVVVPALLAAYDLCFKRRAFGLGAIARLGPFLFMLALYLAVRLPTSAAFYPVPPWTQLVRNYAYYVLTAFFVIPRDYLGSGADEAWRSAPLLPVMTVGLSGLAFAVVLRALRWSLLGEPTVIFGLVWLVVSPLPTVFGVAERFMYVPSFGSTLVATAVFSLLLQRFGSDRRPARFLPALFVGFLLVAHVATALERSYWLGMSASVVEEAVRAVHRTYPGTPPDRPLAFVNVPRTIGMAPAMPSVMPAALWLTYGSDRIEAVQYVDQESDLDTPAKRREVAQRLVEEGYEVFIYERGTLALFSPHSPSSTADQEPR